MSLRMAAYGALALFVASSTEVLGASPECVGDCSTRGYVSAADLLRMVDIAAGNQDVSTCSTGHAGDDGEITEDEVDAAVHNLFGARCAQLPVIYDALAGDLYHIVYPARLVTLEQASAIVAALEQVGWTTEEELQALLAQLLAQYGVAADRFDTIVIQAQREAEDCQECLATCTGRCVQSPRGDCFCYERLPTDPPARTTIAILFLENFGDDVIALEADRVPCHPTTFTGGVNDTFSTANGSEGSSAGAGLTNLIQLSVGKPPANFDFASLDRPFGHTFVLPQGKCLYDAKLALRVRPLAFSPSPASPNDVIHLGFVNPAGQFVGAHWIAYFGPGTNNTGLPILLSQIWRPSNYPASGVSFVFNLASLPGGLNLLPDLDSKRALDVLIQDDTSVDYISLVARLCDCPTPTPTVTLTRTRTSTPTSTPPPAPTATRTTTPTPTATPTITPIPTPTATSPPPMCSTTVCKQSVPAGGTGFPFTSGGLFQGVVLDDGQCATRVTPCGPIFDVVELPKAGSTLTNIACTFTAGTGTVSIIGASINPTNAFEPGDNQVVYYFPFTISSSLQCTFTNVVAPTASSTPTGTATPTPTTTPTRTNTVPSSTPTPTATQAPTSTLTSSPTRTASLTPTASFTPTAVPTVTSTRTATATLTTTPSATLTRTTTATQTPTRTHTAVVTPPCVVPPNNMVAWWRLDDAAGASTVVDIGLPPANTGVPQPGAIQPFPPAASGPATVAGNLITSPPDTALYFYGQNIFVEVPHGSDLDLANSDLTVDAWVKPLPGPWSASRDSLHVYTVVDKLNLAANSGYAFYVEVRSTCATCPPPGQQPPPGGVPSTTEFRLVLMLGDGTSLHPYSSLPFYSGSGTVHPTPTPATPLAPQPPDWTHVTVGVDRSQNVGKFYVDGVHLAGSDFTPVVAGQNNSQPLWLGGTRLYGTSYAPQFSEFTLNEIEVFNAALSAAEVQSIGEAAGGKCTPTPTATPLVSATRTRTFTASPTFTRTLTFTPTPTFTRAPATSTPTRTSTNTPTSTRTSTATPTRTRGCVTPPPAMIGWWTADNTTNDFSGNNRHGAFFQPPGAYTAGVVGNAFLLPQLTDFVQVPNHFSLNFTGNFSIDAWIRTTNAGEAAIVSKELNAGSNPVGYYFYVLQGRLGFELGDGQPSLKHQSSGPLISDGLWHHVAVTLDRSSATGGNLYVDGAPVLNFDPTTRPGSIANGFALRIGQHYISATDFTGAIDEVELFSRELTAQEVQAIFDAGSFGKCKTPLPTFTATPTLTRTPTITRTPTTSPTATNTPTLTFTRTATLTRTSTPTPSSTLTATNTRTPSNTATSTGTPTQTATRTITPTVTQTATVTLTRTPSDTPTRTSTPSQTRTPTITATRTATATVTVTRTRTPTPSCFAELCVTKFNDQDGDGVHDPGEPGLAGWTINVTDMAMNVIPVITGAQGTTCVGVPAPVVYNAFELPQAGWTQTFPAGGNHLFGIECGQLVNIEFGNMSNATRTPTRTPTQTVAAATPTSTPTRTPRISPPD